MTLPLDLKHFIVLVCVYACTSEFNTGSSRKLLSVDSDFRDAFLKNLPVSNEHIDAFNRGERQFINEQLELLTLKQDQIEAEVEKALLELPEDEDYRSGWS